MLIENKIAWTRRVKELVIDYICILIYLIILFGVSMVIYFGILGHIPELSELQSQLISTFTSVLPIVLFFTILDFKNGSVGKRKAQLKLWYKHKSFKASLFRNIIKFLPWEFAHIGVVHGMYSNFDLLAIAFTIASMILAIAMLIMGLARKDKRHLGDLIAETQVQVK